MRRLTLWPLLPAAVLAAGLTWYLHQEFDKAGHVGFPLDDTWIHLTLASNLTEGRGFAVNPGDPVGASTAPLWTVLLVPILTIFGPSPAALKVLGILLTLLGLEGIRRLYLALRPGRTREAALAASLAAVLPSTLWGALSGLEVPLAMALVAAALVTHFKYRGAGGGRGLVAPFLMGLAALTRPEALLLFPLSILDSPEGWNLRRLIPRTLAFLLPLTPVVLIHLWAHGTPLPTTFYAKIHNSQHPDGGQGLFWALGAGRFEEAARLVYFWPFRHLAMFLSSLARMNPFWLLFIPLGLGCCFSSASEGKKARLLPLLALVVIPCAMGIFTPRPDVGAGDRYVSFLNPVVAVLAMAGLRAILGRLPAWMSGFLLVLTIAASVSALDQGARYHGMSVKNTRDMHLRLAHWVRKNLPPGSTAAVHDIGALGFHGGLRLLDLVGIASPDLLEHKSKPESLYAALHRLRPEYLIVAPHWYPDLVRHTDVFSPIHEQRIPPGENHVLASPVMVVFRARWPAQQR